MKHFTSVNVSADKHQQLLKASDDLARINAKLIETLQRHNAETNPLVLQNEELLHRCSQFLAGMSV